MDPWAPDRFLGFRDHGLLAGDGDKIGDRAVDLLALARRLADSHVDDNLFQTWNLHRIGITELFEQGWNHGLLVMVLQAGHPVILNGR